MMQSFIELEKNFDAQPYERVVSATWPTLPLSVAILYFLFVMVAPLRMRHHAPIRLRKSVALWNLALCLFSFCGTTRLVPVLISLLTTGSFRETVCGKPYYMDSGASGLWSMLFVFSKVAELLDTVFLVLSKKPLVFLHWYHHLTVLLLSWHGYLSRPSMSIYAMVMNYSVHTIMYGYYFLHSVAWWPHGLSPHLITIAQILQMVVGFFLSVAGISYKVIDPQCQAPLSNMISAAVIYSTYFYLFVRFFSKRFLRPKTV